MVMLIVVVAVLIVVTQLLQLPVSLPAATTSDSQFSGGRSRALLENICSSDASPRSAASDGNYLTQAILLDAVKEINKITGVTLIKDERWQQPVNDNSTDKFWSSSNTTTGAAYWQVSTQEQNGVCDRNLCVDNRRGCETCIKNILLRLRAADGSGTLDAPPRRGTLLLAAHYDTVPGTQGATDDGVGTAGT